MLLFWSRRRTRLQYALQSRSGDTVEGHSRANGDSSCSNSHNMAKPLFLLLVYETASSPSNGDANGNVSSLNCLSLIVESIVSPHRPSNATPAQQMAPPNSIAAVCAAVAASSSGSGAEYEPMMIDGSNIEQQANEVMTTGGVVRSSSAELTDLDAMHAPRSASARPASVHSYSNLVGERCTSVANVQSGSRRESPVGTAEESATTMQPQSAEETQGSAGTPE